MIEINSIKMYNYYKFIFIKLNNLIIQIKKYIFEIEI